MLFHKPSKFRRTYIRILCLGFFLDFSLSLRKKKYSFLLIGIHVYGYIMIIQNNEFHCGLFMYAYNLI